jgi:hypothetical protein
MKILLWNFNAKVGREDIFKLTIGNESLNEISNDNGASIVNFATSKNLTVKSTMFPHCNIHKFNWTPPDEKTDHILTEDGIQVYLTSSHSGQQIVILTTVWWLHMFGRDWQWVNKQYTDFMWRSSISRD